MDKVSAIPSDQNQKTETKSLQTNPLKSGDTVESTEECSSSELKEKKYVKVIFKGDKNGFENCPHIRISKKKALTNLYIKTAMHFKGQTLACIL